MSSSSSRAPMTPCKTSSTAGPERYRRSTFSSKRQTLRAYALAVVFFASAWAPLAGASEKASTARPVRAAEALNSTPEELVGAFARHFNAGQSDLLMGLYDSQAVFVPAPGKPLNTPEGIRAATAQFMGMRVPIQIVVRHIYQSGDVALVVSDWTIQGKTPSGDSVELAGTATDVLRKSRSKGWLYIIDNPFGGQQPQQ